MTQDEIDNGIGSLVRRYSDNEKTVAVLKLKIGEIDSQLNTLRAELEKPESITLPIELDVENLNVLISEFHQSINEKKALGGLLTQAGLGRLTREQ